ncbi:hypothetical protein GCM10020221_11520 [Streptomyces thioluteus]|uniref:Transposase n=1 Tax=Streptomyces thioluteus TaxID=66431 RepID=A0ABP6J1C4_STRTU
MTSQFLIQTPSSWQADRLANSEEKARHIIQRLRNRYGPNLKIQVWQIHKSTDVTAQLTSN